MEGVIQALSQKYGFDYSDAMNTAITSTQFLSVNSEKPKIHERELQEYDEDVREDYADHKISLLAKLRIMSRKSAKKGQELLFNNQRACGSEVSASFINLKLLALLVIGQTQSGKTGAMLATIKAWLDSKEKAHTISVENIYIITGLSSKEWKKQTKRRFPDEIQKRIFHLPELPKKFLNDIKGKKNCLVFMDEIQIAAKVKQTLDKVFKKLEFNNLQYLLKNDIKLIEFSATPDGVGLSLIEWGDHQKILSLQPGIGYISSENLMQQGRAKQFKDLYGYLKKTNTISEAVKKNITEFKSDIEQFDKDNRGPLFHIIRTHNGHKQQITINTIKKQLGEEDFDYQTFDCETSAGQDLNTILEKRPLKHTIIFIKEMQRCAKTLLKKYIGIAYDRWVRSKPNDSTMIQGLLGRMTGYDDNGFSIVYTNIKTIPEYSKLLKCGFNQPSDSKILWKSATTKNRNGKIVSNRGTFMSQPEMGNGKDKCNPQQAEMCMKKFNSEEESRNYFNEEIREKLGRTSNGNLRARPQKTKKDEKGFPIFRGERRSIVDMNADPQLEKPYGRSHNLNKNHGSSWLIPCYGDITDKDTIEWRLYYLIKNE